MTTTEISTPSAESTLSTFSRTSRLWDRYSNARREFEENRSKPEGAFEMRRNSLLTRLEAQQNEVLLRLPDSAELAPVLHLSLEQAIKAYEATGMDQLRLVAAAANFVDDRLLAARAEARQAKLAEWVGAVLAVGGLLAIVAMMLLAQRSDSGSSMLPLFDVPLVVVAWGLAGAVLSAVARYAEGRLSKLSLPLRWVMSRPSIAVATGVLAYLVLAMLWSLFGRDPGESAILLSLSSLVAFVAGASERLTELLLRVLSDGLQGGRSLSTSADDTGEGTEKEEPGDEVSS